MVRLRRFGLFFLAVILCGLVGCTTLPAFKWDGTQWQIISINPAVPDSFSKIATLDPNDPYRVISDTFTVDSANGKAYLCGSYGSGYKIYTISLTSPYAVSSVPPVPSSGFGTSYFAFRSYKEGKLIGYRWNSSQLLEIISINPVSGQIQLLATLGLNDPDVVFLNCLAVDSANDKAYLCGSYGSSYKIYTIGPINLYSSNNPVSSVTCSGFGTSYFAFRSYKEGKLIGYRWNVSQNGTQLEIISIDPTNGQTRPLATLGPNDPYKVFVDTFAVDSANDKAYLCGQKDTETFYRIYTIDLETGDVSSVKFSDFGTSYFGFGVYSK